MITVLGGSGFIGSHLVRRLRETGAAHWAPERGDQLAERPLGTVLYCIGLTADFRERPLATVEAHVSTLAEVFRHADFDRLVYLSSTRVYRLGGGPCREDDALSFDVGEPDDLYGLSKALGEAVALRHRDTRIVRLSNVYGMNPTSRTFLAAVIGAAVRDGVVMLGQTLDSAKDYVSLHDAVDLVLRIAVQGRDRVYNVASGLNVTHAQIVETLRAVIGCRVEVRPGAPCLALPPISIARAVTEFGYQPARLLDDLPGLVASYVAFYGVGA